MKKIAVIAIQHPTEPNLFLHGLRRDNKKWACAGGHCHPGETDHESATRELEEETGLKGVKIEKVHERTYGQNNIILFHGVHPAGQLPDAKADPDKEFVTFKFLDPNTHENLHVPTEHNIVSDWIKKTPPAPITKASGKIKVEPFVVEPSAFNPKKHDFIVRYQMGGKQVGFLAVTHKKDGIMPFNFEVKQKYQRKGIGSAMASHAQKLSGKKLARSPDMTEAGRAFANKFIGPDGKIKKSEQPAPAPAPINMVLQIPVSLHGKTTKMTVKNFGDMNQIDHQTIQRTIEGQKFHEPIDAKDMIFKPHVLKGVDGKEMHILLVYGAPKKIMNMKGSTPYIPIDKEDYEKFSKLGPALTSEATGVKFHPAELKAGDQVIRTY